jgi:hypothetical protein
LRRMRRIFSFPCCAATFFTHPGLIEGHFIYETTKFSDRNSSAIKLGYRLVSAMMARYTVMNPFPHPWVAIEEFFQICSLVSHTRSAAIKDENPEFDFFFVGITINILCPELRK